MAEHRKILTSFDSVVLSAVVVDLEPYVGGSIVRIAQPSSDEVIIEVRRGRTTGRILISIHPQWARVHLTQPRGPGELSPFAQMLRRRVRGGVLRSVRQPSFERTLRLDIETDDDGVALVIEIMGRHSNLILVENDRIAGSLKIVPRSKSSVREIRPGLPFVPVPQDRPALGDLTAASLADRLAQARVPLAKALASSVLGISPVLAAELLYRSGLAPDEMRSGHDAIAARLWPRLEELVVMVNDRQFAPTLYLDGTVPAGFTPFPFGHLKATGHQPTRTMSDAVDAVLTRAGLGSRLEDSRASTVAAIDATLGRIRRTEEEIAKSISEADSAEDLRAQGDLLLAYATQIEPGASEARIAGYDGKFLVVTLNPDLTPIENAQTFFKRYRRLRDARPGLLERQQRLASERASLEETRAMAQAAVAQEDLDAIRRELVDEGLVRLQTVSRSRERAAGPRAFTLPGGTVLVGRTNRENDRLTFAQASPEDLWFHARGVGGAHIVLKTKGKSPSARLIAQAASIAAYFSRARGSGKVPVDYTLRKYVRKPKGARPGLVTYEREKTILAKPELPQQRQT